MSIEHCNSGINLILINTFVLCFWYLSQSTCSGILMDESFCSEICNLREVKISLNCQIYQTGEFICTFINFSTVNCRLESSLSWQKATQRAFSAQIWIYPGGWKSAEKITKAISRKSLFINSKLNYLYFSIHTSEKKREGERKKWKINFSAGKISSQVCVKWTAHNVEAGGRSGGIFELL